MNEELVSLGKSTATLAALGVVAGLAILAAVRGPSYVVSSVWDGASASISLHYLVLAPVVLALGVGAASIAERVAGFSGEILLVPIGACSGVAWIVAAAVGPLVAAGDFVGADFMASQGSVGLVLVGFVRVLLGRLR